MSWLLFIPLMLAVVVSVAVALGMIYLEWKDL